MQVTSPKEKLRKNERKGKFLHLFSFFIGVQASKLGVFALFRMQVTSPKEKLRKNADFRKQLWRINATKCIDKGISRKNEAIQSEGSTQIWEDCFL